MKHSFLLQLNISDATLNVLRHMASVACPSNPKVEAQIAFIVANAFSIIPDAPILVDVIDKNMNIRIGQEMQSGRAGYMPSMIEQTDADRIRLEDAECENPEEALEFEEDE